MSVKWRRSSLPGRFESEEGHVIDQTKPGKWEFVHKDGRRVELPKKPTFDHAEAALAKLENAQ